MSGRARGSAKAGHSPHVGNDLLSLSCLLRVILMRRVILAFSALALVNLLVFLILEEGRRDELADGFLDPILGLDHFMVLVGVGLWAGRWGGTAQWLLPVAFLLGTPVGYVLAAGQPPVPLVDGLVHVLVVGSLLLIAGVLAFPVKMPMPEAASTVAMFGGCHGYVHGLEQGRDGPVWFEVGSLAMAAALLALGVLAGLVATRTGGSS